MMKFWLTWNAVLQIHDLKLSYDPDQLTLTSNETLYKNYHLKPPEFSSISKSDPVEYALQQLELWTNFFKQGMDLAQWCSMIKNLQ